jgi:hypothetical protein
MCSLVHLHIRTLSGPDHIKPKVDALVIVLPMYGSVLFDTLETGSIIHTPSVPLSGGVLKTGYLYLHSMESKRTIPGEREPGELVLTWHFAS